MWPLRIVVGDPGSGDLPSLIEIEEQAFVEQLVAHAPVEGFDIAVLHRLAGRDVVPFDLMLFATTQDGIRGELSAVVRSSPPRIGRSKPLEGNRGGPAFDRRDDANESYAEGCYQLSR
jgi:hypothetical protein